MLAALLDVDAGLSGPVWPVWEKPIPSKKKPEPDMTGPSEGSAMRTHYDQPAINLRREHEIVGRRKRGGGGGDGGEGDAGSTLGCGEWGGSWSWTMSPASAWSKAWWNAVRSLASGRSWKVGRGEEPETPALSPVSSPSCWSANAHDSDAGEGAFSIDRPHGSCIAGEGTASRGRHERARGDGGERRASGECRRLRDDDGRVGEEGGYHGRSFI